ncbi:hypothetical protein VULLAG_LOCUS5204 [Vulpes lagopus]
MQLAVYTAVRTNLLALEHVVQKGTPDLHVMVPSSSVSPDTFGHECGSPSVGNYLNDPPATSGRKELSGSLTTVSEVSKQRATFL